MRLASLAVMALVAPALAHADDAADVAALIAEGQELAKTSQFVQAIDRFKRADRITPTAKHACMIGLTYLRLSMLPRSEVFLARCRQRATADDPIPNWLADAERQLADQLALAAVSTIELRVTPTDAGASITVSTFGVDESFPPQRIHLGVGPHTLTVSAPGFVTAETSIEVTGPGSMPIDIVLERTVVTPPSDPLGTPRPRRGPFARPDHSWSNRMFVGAGVATAGGIVLHVLAHRTRDVLIAAKTSAEYHQSDTRFEVERWSAISLYGVAAIAGGLGLYLRFADRDGPQFSADLRPGGGVLTVGWVR